MTNQHIYIQCTLKVIVYTIFIENYGILKNGGNIND